MPNSSIVIQPGVAHPWGQAALRPGPSRARQLCSASLGPALLHATLLFALHWSAPPHQGNLVPLLAWKGPVPSRGWLTGLEVPAPGP